MSLAKEMWVGIDVDHAVADLQGAKWVLHRSLDPETFLLSPIGQELIPLEGAALRSVALAMASVSRKLPIVSKMRSHFNVSGALRELSYRVVWMNNYYISVQVLQVNVSFRLSWANPCWNALDYDPSSQLQEVASRLSASLQTIQQTQWISNESVTDFEVVYRPSKPEELWFMAGQMLKSFI